MDSVPGLLVTDPKGAYDATVKQETTILGLSNTRAAVQGYAVKQSLRDKLLDIVWLAAGWNLPDALTKAAATARAPLERWLSTG